MLVWVFKGNGIEKVDCKMGEMGSNGKIEIGFSLEEGSYDGFEWGDGDWVFTQKKTEIVITGYGIARDRSS